MASLTLTNAYIPKADYFFHLTVLRGAYVASSFLLLFPFLVPIARNYKGLFCVFLISAILVIVGMYFTPESDIKGYWYVNPIARFPDFIVGMLLFQLYDRLKIKTSHLSKEVLLK